MPRVRVLLVWFMIALVPLSGMAAAYRSCCGMRADETLSGGAIAQMAQMAGHVADREPVLAISEGAPIADGCGICQAHCHMLAIVPIMPAMHAHSYPRQHPEHTAPTVANRALPVAEKPPRG